MVNDDSYWLVPVSSQFLQCYRDDNHRSHRSQVAILRFEDVLRFAYPSKSKVFK